MCWIFTKAPYYAPHLLLDLPVDVRYSASMYSPCHQYQDLLDHADRHCCHTATSCNFLLMAVLSFASEGSLKLAVSTHVNAERPDSTIIAVL